MKGHRADEPMLKGQDVRFRVLTNRSIDLAAYCFNDVSGVDGSGDLHIRFFVVFFA